MQQTKGRNEGFEDMLKHLDGDGVQLRLVLEVEQRTIHVFLHDRGV